MKTKYRVVEAYDSYNVEIKIEGTLHRGQISPVGVWTRTASFEKNAAGRKKAIDEVKTYQAQEKLQLEKERFQEIVIYETK